LKEPVCILGAGSWGTALAMLISRQERKVRLVSRTPEKASEMARERENSRYLPGIRFPDALSITADAGQALEGTGAVILAVPCKALHLYLPLLAEGSTPVISACKGLHPETMERMDEFLARFLGMERVVLLSGPSFAVEVARGLPAAVTMAAADEEYARRAAGLFSHSNLRVYTSNDLIGVGLGGALKNVYAIAAGIADGLELGHNAIAALITRGLSEMMRLAIMCGGREETLMGLSGLGDLVLTCTSDLSRNRRLGLALARGVTLDTAKEEIGQVIEGVRTAEAAYGLAQEKHIETPIIAAVHQVIQGRVTALDAVRSLLQRAEKSEKFRAGDLSGINT